MTDQSPTTTLFISGMTCANCDSAVERALGRVPGVQSVEADYRQGTARITGHADASALEQALKDEGYGFGSERPSTLKRFAEAGAALLIVFAVLLAAQHLGLTSRISVTDNMSLGFVFVIGLLASVSSCIAVTGGLLVALTAKYNETATALSPLQRFGTHLYFHAGRILSYTGFGAVIGLAGSVFALSPMSTGIITIAVSALIVIIGLQMLGLLQPIGAFFPALSKGWRGKIHALVERDSKPAAFALGAATFFLPCGFTLALQLYVLTLGSAGAGALHMLVFSLGTLPALVALSLVSTFSRGTAQMRFLKIAGAAMVLLGVMNIQFGLVQTGNSPTSAMQNAAVTVAPQTASQIVEMKVVGLEYSPNRFTVKAGVPVEWRIDAREAEGCGRVLISRALGVTKFLSSTDITVITFTASQAGQYAFNCSMGMMTPNSAFNVIN